MTPVFIDIESYYDDVLSLTKMTTSGYVRHPDFEVLLCGIKVGDQPTQVYAGMDHITAALRGIDWKNAILICHNAMFDAFILTQIFQLFPAQYCDTLSLVRAQFPHWAKHSLAYCADKLDLKPKATGVLTRMKGKRLADLTEDELQTFKEYCADDTDTCAAIYHRISPGFPDAELRLISMTVRLFAEPILVINEERASDALKAEIAEKRIIQQASGVDESILRSTAKVAEEFKKLGVKPPSSFSKTDRDFKALLVHPDEKVRTLALARQRWASSLPESRSRRFQEEGASGPLPVGLRYYAAHTGRWGGANKLNLQNLPRGGELRKCIEAPPGHVLVVGDLSQIECRMLAWLAKEETLLQIFREKRDPYGEFATKFYGFEVTKGNPKTSNERFVGKTCVLGLGFGMGAPKLQFSLENGKPPQKLGIDRCYGLVYLYRTMFPEIPKLWRKMGGLLRPMTTGEKEGNKLGPLETDIWTIWMPNGMALQYWNLLYSVERDDEPNGAYQNEKGQEISLYGGKMTENVVQALARNVMAEAMLRIDEELQVVMHTHDEIVVVAKESEAEDAVRFVEEEMVRTPDWCPGIPLASEVGFDYCYSK